jgi:hypothetical protein
MDKHQPLVGSGIWKMVFGLDDMLPDLGKMNF